MDHLLAALALAWRDELARRGGAAEADAAADLELLVLRVAHRCRGRSGGAGPPPGAAGAPAMAGLPPGSPGSAWQRWVLPGRGIKLAWACHCGQPLPGAGGEALRAPVRARCSLAPGRAAILRALKAPEKRAHPIERQVIERREGREEVRGEGLHAQGGGSPAAALRPHARVRSISVHAGSGGVAKCRAVRRRRAGAHAANCSRKQVRQRCGRAMRERHADAVSVRPRHAPRMPHASPPGTSPRRGCVFARHQSGQLGSSCGIKSTRSRLCAGAQSHRLTAAKGKEPEARAPSARRPHRASSPTFPARRVTVYPHPPHPGLNGPITRQ